MVGATGTTGQPGVFSPFTQDVELFILEETAACLWVYEESPQNGAATNIAQVPIAVAP